MTQSKELQNEKLINDLYENCLLYTSIEGPRKQVEKIRKAYEVWHAEELLLHETPEGTHRWYGGGYKFAENFL